MEPGEYTIDLDRIYDEAPTMKRGELLSMAALLEEYIKQVFKNNNIPFPLDERSPEEGLQQQTTEQLREWIKALTAAIAVNHKTSSIDVTLL